MKEEHWRIIIADTECPFREKGDNPNCDFCGKRKTQKIIRIVRLLTV